MQVQVHTDNHIHGSAELSSRGEVSQPLQEKPFGKVFAMKDPAGRPRFVLELARSRPSQAVT